MPRLTARTSAWAIGLALVVPLLATAAATTPPANANATTERGGTQVVFWAGEEVPDGSVPGDPEDFWRPRELSQFTPALWEVLGRHRTPVYFNFRYKRDFGPVPPGRGPYNEMLPLFKEARKRGVPVGIWLTVPPDDGYFAWEGGAAVQKEAIIAAEKWRKAHGLDFVEYVLDLEPSLAVVNELRKVQGGDLGAMPAMFEKTLDPAKNCQGRQAYVDLYRWAKSRGLGLSVSVPPIPIDDNVDGTMALQDGTDMTLAPGSFDKLWTQAYRNELDMFGDPGASIMTSYWRDTRQQYGDKGEITIGTPGQTGYLTAEQLGADVRHMATLGATQVPIYTLERAAEAYGPAGVEKVITSTTPYTGFDAWMVHNFIGPSAVAQRGALSVLDVAATTATPLVTAAKGSPQLPKTFAGGPLGCP